MTNHRLQSHIRRLVQVLQQFVDRIWYPPFIGFLAALDNLIVIIPNDGILISSCMLTPKRWLYLATCVALGSTIGAVILASLVELQGLPWILEYFPGIDQSSAWLWTQEFFDQYGFLVLFAVAAAPVVQQPAVILAALANKPLIEIAAVVLAGRFLKFLIMAKIAQRAPALVTKLWGVKGDLEDVGIKAG